MLGLHVIKRDMQEAMRAAHTAWATPIVPASVKALFDDAAAVVGNNTPLFWVMVAALKRFVVCYCQCTHLPMHAEVMLVFASGLSVAHPGLTAVSQHQHTHDQYSLAIGDSFRCECRRERETVHCHWKAAFRI
jgi:hypothetical protein